MNLLDILAQFIPNTNWFAVITAVVTLASAITAATPTPAPGTLLSKIYKLIEILALNIGKSKDTGVNDKPLTGNFDK
jgi:hypothetical protein